MSTDPPSHARLHLPAWLWGGDPARLLTECRYRSRSDASGGHLVQTEERYFRRQPDLVRCATIAGPAITQSRFQDLAGLQERIELRMPPAIDRALARRKAKAEKSLEIVDRFSFEQMAMFATPTSNLPERAKYLLEELRAFPMEDDPTVHPFR